MGCVVHNKKQTQQNIEHKKRQSAHNQRRNLEKPVNTETSIEDKIKYRKFDRQVQNQNGQQNLNNIPNAAGQIQRQQQKLQRIRNSYKLDIDESLPEPSKVQKFEYQQLLVHNPNQVSYQ